MADPHPIPAPFRPDPATLARLLADLADSDLTLRQIARDYRTDLFQLNTFLANSPAITEAHHAAALRIRLAAASQLPEVIPALLTMIRSYEFETNRLRPRTPELELRLADHARDSRRAMHLLYRIANYNPRPLRIGYPHSPSGIPAPGYPHSPSGVFPPNPVSPTNAPSPCATEQDQSEARATPPTAPASNPLPRCPSPAGGMLAARSRHALGNPTPPPPADFPVQSHPTISQPPRDVGATSPTPTLPPHIREPAVTPSLQSG